jgi:dTDP-glucose 4,6-dehydratase
MKILVTGGYGFIGSNLVKKLLLNKNYSISNIDKLGYASNSSYIEDFIDESNKNYYHFFELDLINNKKLEKVFNAIKPDIVMHLAAESHVDRSISSSRIFIESNIIGTFNLLESSRKYFESLNVPEKSNFRFHHISTDEVFGSLGESGTFSETTPYDPRSPYSASKASSDHLVRSWHHTYGLPVIITNCSNNYGPWQFPEKLIPLTILKAINSEKIPIYGDGSNVRDWLFVEDHVNALILSAMKGEIGETYCIGGFGERTNLEVVEKICDILDDLIPKSFKHKDLISFVTDRKGHDKRYSINSEKIQSELGWKPKYSFDEGLLETVSWYLKNKNIFN